jgi:hypothetical protein
MFDFIYSLIGSSRQQVDTARMPLKDPPWTSHQTKAVAFGSARPPIGGPFATETIEGLRYIKSNDSIYVTHFLGRGDEEVSVLDVLFVWSSED